MTGSFNDASVWDFAGLTDSLVVAVVDDDVTTHYDLPPQRIVTGYCCQTGGAGVAPLENKSHGMACAGLIAASHSPLLRTKGTPDYTGIISMDPHVMIMPIKVTWHGGWVEDEDIAAGITWSWQHGADVLSISVGFDPLADVIWIALSNAGHSGRGGRGCPIVCAAGNEGRQGLSFPAMHDSTFSVGACGLGDWRWPYSNYSAALDVVAPSGEMCWQGDVWSLDQEDDLGMNPTILRTNGCPDSITWDCGEGPGNNGDFNCRFGGTSASAAIAAGATALVLARDTALPRICDTSDLSVYDILRGSAVPLTETVPDPEYGYGRVDAFRAVLSIARGDANNNGTITIGDVMYLVGYMFYSGPAPFPDSLLGDVTCDGQVTIGDITLLNDHLFVSGDPLPLPCFEFND